jgi:type IV pilus assembly protein PilM
VARQVVGLKLGASRLNAACVSVNGSVEVVQLAAAPLPAGLVVGGEVRDVAQLAEALKEFFKRHKLPKRNVRIGLANNRIGVRTIEVTGIEDPKLLGNAVRFRAQEALPIPIDEAVLDFQILSQAPAESGPPTYRVLLVVAYRDLVAAYAEAAWRASTSRPSRSSAPSRRRSPPRRAAAPTGAPSSPSPSARSAASSASPTASAASTRACSPGAGTPSPTPSPARSSSSPRTPSA